jgi:signal transduction histidine kinase/ActR/RegA family two-component response regulator
MLALMALRQFLTLRKISSESSWKLSFDFSSVEVPGLAVSMFAGLSVVFLSRMIEEQRKVNDELRSRDAQLLQSQKMEALGQLAGRTAHDFNNLLTVIIGNAELARLQLPEGHPALENIIELEKASERGASLSSQVLSFSRKQLVEQSIYDMNELMQELRGMVCQLLGTDVEYVLLPMATKAIVNVDRSQIEQVLLNLAVNARDAMPTGGTVTATTNLDFKGDQPLINITFRDTGEGMTIEDRQRAFEPFFTTKPIGKGTGLGLATCLGNVERNGGTISIQDTSSSGTTFLIQFPQAVEDMAVQRPLINVSENVEGSECLLIVEDETQLRILQSQMLRGLGYEVLEASNGVDAMALMDSSNSVIDMIITDIVMPVMGGLELVRLVREQNNSIPILFMSGFVQSTESDDFIQDGLISFLQKPFTNTMFAQRIRAILDRKIADSAKPY